MTSLWRHRNCHFGGTTRQRSGTITPRRRSTAGGMLVTVVSFPAAEPPCVAVIFSSVQTADTAGYDEAAEQMDRLAAEQPGYLGIESVRDPATGAGITVSYWRTEEDAAAWKRVAEHAAVQRTGRERWYQRYRVAVATVTRSYGFER
jgi:heme-degrading monooxygenase HmoA